MQISSCHYIWMPNTKKLSACLFFQCCSKDSTYNFTYHFKVLVCLLKIGYNNLHVIINSVQNGTLKHSGLRHLLPSRLHGEGKAAYPHRVYHKRGKLLENLIQLCNLPCNSMNLLLEHYWVRLWPIGTHDLPYPSHLPFEPCGQYHPSASG